MISYYPRLGKMLSDVNTDVELKKDEFVHIVVKTELNEFLISPFKLINDKVIIVRVKNSEITRNMHEMNGFDLMIHKKKTFPKYKDYMKYKRLMREFVNGNIEVVYNNIIMREFYVS